jgi:hypothetical protein
MTRLFKKISTLKNEKRTLNKKLYLIEKQILVIECSDRMRDFKFKQLVSLRKIQAEFQIKLKEIEKNLGEIKCNRNGKE